MADIANGGNAAGQGDPGLNGDDGGFWKDTTAVLGVFLVIPLVVLIAGLIYVILRISRNRQNRASETKVYRLDGADHVDGSPSSDVVGVAGNNNNNANTPGKIGRISYGWGASDGGGGGGNGNGSNSSRLGWKGSSSPQTGGAALPRASEMMSTDEERIRVMELVKTNKMTIDQALEVIKHTETRRRSQEGMREQLPPGIRPDFRVRASWGLANSDKAGAEISGGGGGGGSSSAVHEIGIGMGMGNGMSGMVGGGGTPVMPMSMVDLNDVGSGGSGGAVYPESPARSAHYVQQQQLLQQQRSSRPYISGLGMPLGDGGLIDGFGATPGMISDNIGSNAMARQQQSQQSQQPQPPQQSQQQQQQQQQQRHQNHVGWADEDGSTITPTRQSSSARRPRSGIGMEPNRRSRRGIVTSTPIDTDAIISAVRTPGSSRRSGGSSRRRDGSGRRSNVSRAAEAAERTSRVSQLMDDAARAACIRQLPATATVEFFGNVRGDYDLFMSIVDQSSVLSQWSDGTLKLNRGCYLIYGGNVVGQGGGDIRIARGMVKLKQMHPDRVFLLLGDTDVQQMRLASELADGRTGDDVDVYWDDDHVPFAEYAARRGYPLNSHASTLRWILECSFGLPAAFEARRSELGLLYDGAITDDDVVRSYRESVEPKGTDPFMLQYVERAQLMLVIGNKLYTNGPLHANCLGTVPGASIRQTSPQEWCRALHTFVETEVESFKARPRWLGGNFKKQRGGEGLIDYGLPNGFNGLAVVGNHRVHVPADVVRTFLAAEGLTWVGVQSQSVLDTPIVVQRGPMQEAITTTRLGGGSIRGSPALDRRAAGGGSTNSPALGQRAVLSGGGVMAHHAPGGRRRSNLNPANTNTIQRAMSGREALQRQLDAARLALAQTEAQSIMIDRSPPPAYTEAYEEESSSDEEATLV